MKQLTAVLLLVAVALAAGVFIGQQWMTDPGSSPAQQSGEREVLYYKAPMDPNFRSNRPGKSPMGMDLVPVYADEVAGSDPGVVSIDPGIVNNLGVRTALAQRSVLSRRIQTVGHVGYDEDTLHQINTRVDGWVEKLSIKATGDPVTEGQTLFELYSPTLVNAQEEYLAALASSNSALRQASRERLAALGVTAAEIRRLDTERRVRQRVRIDAPSDGVAVRLGVREGGYVTPGTQVLAIAALDRVWLLAEVFERQAGWVRPGQRAEVTLDYLPGERRQGTVDYVYPELDAQTRTLKVRLRFDNPDQALRPNMFARVTIFGTESAPVVHVPREALIRGGAVDRVVLVLGEGRFRAQPVSVGMEAGDRVEIRSGVSAGDRIVTSGQFLIDSESNIGTALARMDDDIAAVEETPARRVRVNAVVRGVDPAGGTLRLEHAPIPDWSWPAMTMRFSVADAALLTGVSDGQSVEAVIEKHGDNHYVVTEIVTGAAPVDHGGHDMMAPMDHSDHDMAAPMDHSGHGMESPQ